MRVLTIPVIGDAASSLVRLIRSTSKWIIFRWCVLCFLGFVVYGGCISALYLLLKYNPEDIVYGICVIAPVQYFCAAITSAEAGGLMQETRALWTERQMLD